MGRDSNDTCRLKLIADIRERRSGVPARLRDLGLLVNEASLPAGDYAVGDDCLVERKAVGDLHRSICNGRLWRQIGALRRSSKSPCLLVEGAAIYNGPVGRAAIRGTLLAIADLSVLVIRSENREEATNSPSIPKPRPLCVSVCARLQDRSGGAGIGGRARDFDDR